MAKKSEQAGRKEKEDILEKPDPKRQMDEEDILELLSPTRIVDVQIEKTFEDLPGTFVALFLEKMADYSLANIRIANYFAKKNIPGVYISTNKPVAALIDNFKEQKIDYKNFYFADAITKISGTELIEANNFAYVDSPKNLIDLSIALETAMQKIKGSEKFVLFDSLSTLLIYNKPSLVAKFVHSIATKIRVWKAKGVFLMIQEKDDDITKIIAQFCDETIEFGKIKL